MKKLISFILVLAMTACMSVTAFADDHSGTQTITTSKAAPGYARALELLSFRTPGI